MDLGKLFFILLGIIAPIFIFYMCWQQTNNNSYAQMFVFIVCAPMVLGGLLYSYSVFTSKD